MNAKADNRFSFRRLSQKCSKALLSKYSYILLFLAACVVSLKGWEVYGAVAFVGFICLTLVFCDDIMASAMPLLLLCVFVTTCYDSADTFLKFVWIAAPVLAAVIFHFVYYRQKITVGKSLYGLIAVSVAITLSGVGVISASDYFSPASLYYIIFLGVGMIGLYLLLKSQLSAERSYDLKEKAVEILYLMGIFASFVILYNVIPLMNFEGGGLLTDDFQASNNLSTMIMFALPAPFFFARRNKLHLLSALLMSASMFVSGSRAGMIFSVVELALCFLVCTVFDRKNRIFYICLMGAALISAGVVWVFFRNELFEFLELLGLYPVVKDNEARMKLIDRAFELFDKYPLTGHGLTYRGNFDIYEPKKGAMGWYHMMIPQVVASMGCVGIAAYGYQFAEYVRILVGSLRENWKNANERMLTVTLFMSYVGVLMMSQVNPGIFCPIPYGLLVTVIFALLEGECRWRFLRSGENASR